MASTEWEDLIALADRLEPQLRDRFLQAVERARAELSLEEVTRALKTGRLDAIDTTPIKAELQHSIDLLTKAAQEAGGLMATQVAAKAGTPFRFDLTNPFAVAQVRQIAALTIDGIARSTQLALRDIVGRAFTDGLTSPQVARLIRPMLGLNDGQARALYTYQALLQRQGLGADKIEALAARYADRLLRDRATMIARTAIMSASNGGQEAAWQQAAQQKLIAPDASTVWIVTPDDRLCPRCQAMKGQRRKLGEFFVCPVDGTRVLFPPLHPRCRCVRGLAVGAYLRAA